jgi:hypothetical protein
MDESEILQVAAEITLLGRFGLDYASPDAQYKLRSLPGEQLSGLQLMCLMYASMKRVHPSVNTGMPLDNAYATALSTCTTPATDDPPVRQHKTAPTPRPERLPLPAGVRHPRLTSAHSGNILCACDQEEPRPWGH